MTEQFDTSEPSKATSRARWSSLAAGLTSWLNAAPTVEPALPRPGTQPIEHLQNALAQWAGCWQECIRDGTPADFAKAAEASRRAIVVARAVASADLQDDVASLLADADRLLLASRSSTPEGAPTVCMVDDTALILDRYAELTGRLRPATRGRTGRESAVRSVS